MSILQGPTEDILQKSKVNPSLTTNDISVILTTKTPAKTGGASPKNETGVKEWQGKGYGIHPKKNKKT